jgi:Uma2 family endonuclease
MPTLPPEIVVEIRSPSDEPGNVEMKREDFLSWGVSLYLAVDPRKKVVRFFDAADRFVEVDGAAESYAHPAFPDLAFPLRSIFAKLDVFENLKPRAEAP